MKSTAVVVAAAFTCAATIASSQQTPLPTFRSGLEILTVEASVRDAAGRPVTDLQPSDFVVSIDGQPRRVLNARMFGTDEVRVAKAGTPVPRFARASDASPGRLIMFAVDRDSIRSGSEKAILNTASAMMTSFSPADAVGVIGLPVGGIDPTRDHSAAAAALGLMTGTRPPVFWRYNMSWDEAVAYERRDGDAINRVIERECLASSSDRECPRELRAQALEMLGAGRGHAQTVLMRLGALLDSLAEMRAPKHLVLFSGGIPFDLDLLSRYRELATKAAQARVAIFVVHLDQAGSDAADKTRIAAVFGGREYARTREHLGEHGGRVLQRRGHRRRRTGSHRIGYQLFLSAGRGGAAHGRRRQDPPGEGGSHASEAVGARARRDCGGATPEVVGRRGRYERAGSAYRHCRSALRGCHIRDARRSA